MVRCSCSYVLVVTARASFFGFFSVLLGVPVPLRLLSARGTTKCFRGRPGQARGVHEVARSRTDRPREPKPRSRTARGLLVLALALPGQGGAPEKKSMREVTYTNEAKSLTSTRRSHPRFFSQNKCPCSRDLKPRLGVSAPLHPRSRFCLGDMGTCLREIEKARGWLPRPLGSWMCCAEAFALGARN